PAQRLLEACLSLRSARHRLNGRTGAKRDSEDKQVLAAHRKPPGALSARRRVGYEVAQHAASHAHAGAEVTNVGDVAAAQATARSLRDQSIVAPGEVRAGPALKVVAVDRPAVLEDN